MIFFLAMQTTYDHLEIALCNEQQLVAAVREDKKDASKNIITIIDSLLSNNKVTLQQLAFIAVNQGPAPFTSLRVVITTANGISFATGIPLRGINGLATFMKEQEDAQWPYTIALLNAFNNDVYYALQTPTTPIQIGCEQSASCLTTLKNNYEGTQLRFIGNGAALFRPLITTTFPNAYIPEPLPAYPLLQSIHKEAVELWKASAPTSKQLLPLYLKTVRYTKSITL